MATEQEINAKNQRELESDLTTTKHQLLSVQHQLNMTEKVRFPIRIPSARRVAFRTQTAAPINKLSSPLTHTRPFSLIYQELEKKFSQTGAYKNLKKMLSAKNEQIKSLRQELKSLRGGKDDEEEE